jgi:ABC-type phosphate/phosphonate transport system substrate-binding protein
MGGRRAGTLLLLLLVTAVAYFAIEAYARHENPLARVASLFQTGTATAAVKAPVLTDGDALVLSSPPRDSAEEGARRFGPMAEYLSMVLDRKVVYRHPGTWGGYQSDLQRDAYDLVFDGPHFVSWRIEKHLHHALVKLPGDFLYVGFVRKENADIQNIDKLAGQPVCVHAPPNLGTLMLLSAFDNPSRQPNIVITKGYDNIYKGLMEGRCVAAMLPAKHLLKHDKDGVHTRVIYSHRPYPQQALTAGVRLSADEKVKIVNALTAPGAQDALADFRSAYALSGWFVPAGDQEYAGLGAYLKTVQGFYKQ